LPVKTRLQNDLLCVEWDIKLTRSPSPLLPVLSIFVRPGSKTLIGNSQLTLYRMVMPIGTPFLKEKLIINQ